MDRVSRDRLGSGSLGIGQALRRAREQRGLTLTRAAEATKIRSDYLLALEEEDFADLPAPVFARGLLRAYSQFLGLNAEELMACLDDHQLLVETAGLQPATPRLRAAASIGPRLATIVVVVGLLGALGYYLYAQYSAFVASEQPLRAALPTPAPAIAASLSTPEPTKAPTPRATPPAPALSPTSPPSATPTPTPQPSPTPTPTPVQIATVEVRFSGDCWVRADVDDAPVIRSQTFGAGDKLTLTGRKLLIRFGNAGVVDIILNGKPLGRLGAPGQPVDWKWTAPS